ncbi:PAS domain S-box protein [Kamptonema formosum]|uniref:PAS domain S-box protein n=1 Tax=Kamptonema formosum TaxID=331992 RepID=UPI0012DE1D6F|nr:PAS domain S-box protein [Oscillatoria sp. PCC 10802]
MLYLFNNLLVSGKFIRPSSSYLDLAFIPDGTCSRWKSDIAVMQAVSDFLTVVVSYTIALWVFDLARRRKNLPFRGMFWLLGGFIIACGTTHLIEVWTLWNRSNVAGVMNFISVAIAVVIARRLMPLIPQALAVANLAQIEAANRDLQKEIAIRREAEAELNRIFNLSADMLCVAGADGYLKRVNPAVETLLGYTPEEFTALPFLNFVHPEDRDATLNVAQKQIERGETVFYFRNRYRCKDGSYKWLSWSSVPVVAEGLIYAAARDITPLKQAEEALHRRSAAIEAATDGIAILNKNGEYTYMNQAHARVYGYDSPAELIGKTWKLLYSSSELKRFEEEIMPEFFIKGSWRGEGFGKKRDGSTYAQEVSLTALEDGGLICIVRDITERKQAEAEIKQLNESLERKVRERTAQLSASNAQLLSEVVERKEAQRQLQELTENLKRSNLELEQFAYVASHDLQEPLRAVTSYTQLLSQRYQGQLDAKADKWVAYIVDGATRMQQLIHDLLAYSRVGTKGKEFQLTDCNAVFKQTLTNLQVAIAEKNAAVTCDPLPTIMADGGQLVQLLQNLIGNAIKFSSSDVPEVHISAVLKNAEWVFAVRDSGIGIAPEYAERIFLIFQRLHSRREYAGTGIGLAICKRIVERHGGRIWVESQVGEGATFYFTIPAIGQSTKIVSGGLTP